MYICEKCDAVIETDECRIEYDDLGLSNDVRRDWAGEKCSVCPCCRTGNLICAERCEICQEYFPVDELCHSDGYMCEDCFNKLDYADIKNVSDCFADISKIDIKVDSLLYFIFGDDKQINEALWALVEQKHAALGTIPVSDRERAKEWALEDKSGFIEQYLKYQRSMRGLIEQCRTGRDI